MKKRILSVLLTLCMVLTLLPTAVVAAETGTGNFAEENVTWIGIQEEFSKTLDGFYNNGMRKVKVAGKWGIMDATGEFIAPPIYDSIALSFASVVDRGKRTETVQHIFLDGYTQCKRNGKYGLLNQYGEEVIPAKYEYVALPSEGVSRVYATSGKTVYIGYWNLEQNREILAPNKYLYDGILKEPDWPTRNQLVTTQAGYGIPGDAEHTRTKGNVQYETAFDFRDGYALVVTSCDSPFIYGTIIDKNGKEILPGGPFLIQNTYGRLYSSYPQFGPYLLVSKKSPTNYNASGDYKGYPYWFSGVVGPQGAIVPIAYSGGQTHTSGEVGDANAEIIAEQKMVIISKDTNPGKYAGGRRGVVNFKNQVVLPFEFMSIDYDPEYQVFIGNRAYDNTGNDVALYNTAGKRISKNYSLIDGLNIVNNYAKVTLCTYDAARQESLISNGFLNVKTGKDCFIRPVTDPERDKYKYSTFSTSGLVWQMNPQGKWGLLDATGKEILPHQYDAVSPVSWAEAKGGYAIVNIGQKQGLISSAGQALLPCEYTSFNSRAASGLIDPEYVVAQKGDVSGLFSVLSRKFVIPCAYPRIGADDAWMYWATYFTLGVNPVKTAEGYSLVDKNGNLIPGSEYNVIKEPVNGLFYTRNQNNEVNRIGPEGKVVFPDTISYAGNKELEDSDMTLVVKDGRVGYINTGLLARSTQPKTFNPTTATAKPSPTKLMVNGKSVAANAYLIGQNNYIKLRDLAYLVNGTDKNFEVTWDGAKNAINLKSGTKYTTVAGDMAPASGGARTATRSSSTVYVDGMGRSLTAYTINGNNYFKLRDVMRVFDIAVGYDSATGTATLDTGMGYERTAAEQGDIIPAPGLVEQIKTRNVLKINKLPVTEYYMTKNHAFDTTGMNVSYFDDNGDKHDVPIDQLTFTADGNKITDGYVFQTSSIKDGKVSYKGVSVSFRIFVYQGVPEVELDPVSGQTDQALPDGKYTISCLGNTFGLSNGWMVLDSKKPVTFDVKKDGEFYRIFEENVTNNIYVAVSPANGQLVAQSSVEK
ncbi:MAG: WG repeat-containing protein, partial [Oscillospiraceae bacterium]|nr:WG repeat-containing protein [Oscillospiraceae bacterium]